MIIGTDYTWKKRILTMNKAKALTEAESEKGKKRVLMGVPNSQLTTSFG